MTHQDQAVSGDADDDDAEVEGEQRVERRRAEAGLTLDSGFEVVDEILEVLAQVFGHRQVELVASVRVHAAVERGHERLEKVLQRILSVF